MTEDLELLSRYASEQSEAAFAEFTRRNVDLVYSAALRLMRGDVHAAQDVTQGVFIEAARQAKRLTRHAALVGWLYTTTRLMALRVNRTEARRKAREQEANTMNQLLQDDPAPTDWSQLSLVIEEAMHELNDKDRHAVLLRFFQNKPLSEVGQALDLNENAARMRVERALDKLRGKLVRRGITTTATALAAAITANAVQAAPAGFAAGLSATAVAGSVVQASTLIAATKTIAMTTVQKCVVAAALAAAAGTGIYAVHHSSQLNARIQTLQDERGPMAAQIKKLEQQRSQDTELLATLSQENTELKSGKSAAEVLRLRGEVGVLRQEAASNQSKTSPPAGGLARMMNDPAMKEYLQRAMTDKMKSLYGDLIKELKLTPEQTDQFLQLMSSEASKSLAKLTGQAQGGADQTAADSPDIQSQFLALLGPEGCLRLKEYSDEMPARATLTQLNSQLGANVLTDEQTANLLQIIKAEPTDLTRGILGGPDPAFLGSQSEIDNFLQQVAQSNQRILQQASGSLNPAQLAALDKVLTKAIDARKIQGAAFFQKN